MKEDSLETIELEMAILVRRITTVTVKKRNTLLERSAYLLMYHLHLHGTIGVKTLASELHLDISTVSRQAASLEQKGFVEKFPNPKDGRSYFYQLTEIGTIKLLEFKKIRLEHFSHLLNDWSEEERQSFGILMRKFNQTLDKKNN